MVGDVLRGFEDAFGAIVLEGYGLSETSPVASCNHPDKERRPGSIGTPIEGVEMRIVDEEDEEVPRGEVGIVVAQMSLATGVVSESLFAAVLTMAVATTLIAPPMLRPLFGGAQSGKVGAP